MYTSFRTELRQLLVEKSDPKAKEWWEGYVKGSAPFLGVKRVVTENIAHFSLESLKNETKYFNKQEKASIFRCWRMPEPFANVSASLSGRDPPLA